MLYQDCGFLNEEATGSSETLYPSTTPECWSYNPCIFLTWTWWSNYAAEPFVRSWLSLSHTGSSRRLNVVYCAQAKVLKMCMDSVTGNMYNANVYCRQRQAFYDNVQTGTVVRDGATRQFSGHRPLDTRTDWQTEWPSIVMKLWLSPYHCIYTGLALTTHSVSERAGPAATDSWH
jgi:hypothetical protein